MSNVLGGQYLMCATMGIFLYKIEGISREKN